MSDTERIKAAHAEALAWNALIDGKAFLVAREWPSAEVLGHFPRIASVEVHRTRFTPAGMVYIVSKDSQAADQFRLRVEGKEWR
jgi:hypothetical protein